MFFPLLKENEFSLRNDYKYNDKISSQTNFLIANTKEWKFQLICVFCLNIFLFYILFFN